MIAKISIIVPFLNEEENIPTLVNELNHYFAVKKNYETEIILVNDGSTDNSVEVLKRQQFLCNFRLISLSKNFGSHVALRAGITHATGTHICFMYADLQDPLSLVDRLFEESLKGYDICWASRSETENGWFEQSFSKFYAYLMKRYALDNYPEKGFDVVMFTSKVQSYVNSNIEANSSIFLQILSLGFRQISINYKKERRRKGKSKWTLTKKIKLMVDSFVAFTYVPIKMVTIFGIFMFLFGSGWSFYLITRRLLYNDLVQGWPLLLSVISIGFGVTNISLGIIAEYLWRTFDSARKRPVFIIDEVAELPHNGNTPA